MNLSLFWRSKLLFFIKLISTVILKIEVSRLQRVLEIFSHYFVKLGTLGTNCYDFSNFSLISKIIKRRKLSVRCLNATWTLEGSIGSKFIFRRIFKISFNGNFSINSIGYEKYLKLYTFIVNLSYIRIVINLLINN